MIEVRDLPQSKFSQNLPSDFSGIGARWKDRLILTLELILCSFVIYIFQIERDQGFLTILPLLIAGFVLQLFLPNRFRLPLFFLLSILSILMLLGLKNGLLVISLGSFLLMICHLPIPYSARLLLVLLIAIFLALVRIQIFPYSWGSKVIPVLAGMFMFRLIIYLYELKQGKTQNSSVWHRLCYFFLLPNVCFQLFPILDYQTFVKSDRKEDPIPAMQQGIVWILRGVIQLLLYRVVYMYWVPSPSDVVNAKTLAIYLITSYALLLRICGQFSLALGIVCLFGFQLPPIFHRYYLATGFSDMWRRTYIYWKDFLTKLFYYKFYFGLKKWGIEIASTLSLLMVFLITWILHSYQFFWLKGKFPITLVDGIFWSVFGLAVTVDSLLQLKKSNQKSLQVPEWNFRTAAKRSLHWFLFFSAMCLFWSFWGSSTIREWVGTVALIRTTTLLDILIFLLIGSSVIVLGAFLQRLRLDDFSLLNRSFYKSAGMVLSILLTLTGLRFGGSSETHLAKLIGTVREPRLNQRDQEVTLKGYYEPLLTREVFARQFQEAMFDDDENHLSKDYMMKVQDMRDSIYRPYYSFFHRSIEVKINRWSMRDKEYSLAKPANTYRFAILGTSIEMGWGVEFQNNFESLVEDKLNRIRPNHKQFEILNFSRDGYSILENAKVCEVEAVRFQPDAVFIFVHGLSEDYRIAQNLRKNDFWRQPNHELSEILPANIMRVQDNSEFQRLVTPKIKALEDWSIRKIASISSSHNAIPVCLYLDTRPDTIGMEQIWSEKSKENGMLFINLHNALLEKDIHSLMLPPSNAHLNVEGHRVVADYLYQEILNHKKELGFK
jgi:hypothetical protein